MAESAEVPAPLGAAAASANQARGAGGFQRDFPALMKAALPEGVADKPVEVWFTDEASKAITRIWAKRGSRPRAPRDRRYEWAELAKVPPAKLVECQRRGTCSARSAGNAASARR